MTADTAADQMYDYTQMTCDIWQIHNLASDWQYRYGWEVVSVVNSYPEAKVPSVVGDENSPHIKGLQPCVLLFRRPIREESDDD